MTSISRYTPRLLPQPVLEGIFVQRQALAQDLVEQIRQSVLTPAKHQTLLIGPRGIGKTHLVSLIYHRIRKMEDLKDRLSIAWLAEDEWRVTSFLDLLLCIFEALEAEYEQDKLAQPCPPKEQIEALYQLPVEAASAAAAALLKEYLGNRTLLLLVENLDELFAGLGKEGLSSLHSFLQENDCCTILATALSEFNAVKQKKSPFYRFFSDKKFLEELTVDDATQLLANIAKLENNAELEYFIPSPQGRDRIQATHHLAGGNHRIYVIFSEFLANSESLAQLVDTFTRTLDNLTPYYQERMRFLSRQQRKIVNFLCDRRSPVPVKEIAQRCFITHQTASSQLKDLRDKGYVKSDVRGRESVYELRERLMGVCLQVKKQRGEPIKLIVEFLRLWYTPDQLRQMMKYTPEHAVMARLCLHLALQPVQEESESERIVALEDKLSDYFANSDFDNALEKAEKLVEIRGHERDWLNQGACLFCLERFHEALTSWDKAIEESELNHDNEIAGMAWGNRGQALIALGREKEALVSFKKVIAIDSNNADAWYARSIVLSRMERYSEAFTSYEKLTKLVPDYAPGWCDRGSMEFVLGRFDAALVSCDNAINLNPNKALYWRNRCSILFGLRRYDEALASCEEAIKLEPNYVDDWCRRSYILDNLKRYDEALASSDKAIELDPNYAEAWFRRGWTMDVIGRYDEALASCDRAIELGYQMSYVFFNRAIAILGLNRWDEGIAALEDAFQRLESDEDAAVVDAKLILRHQFDSTRDVATWHLRLPILLELYHKHQAAPILGQALVRNIPILMSEMVSDFAARSWLEVWQNLAGDRPEFIIPLRLLKTAVQYKEKKGDKRVLLQLPIEERKLLQPLLEKARTETVKPL
ncbi:MAG: tetratricopeptide repeat protein [Hormoscilla sp.]